MLHNSYLHGSFDIQLSPVAVSIIDWAPTKYDNRVNSNTSHHAAVLSSECKKTFGNTSKALRSYEGVPLSGWAFPTYDLRASGGRILTDGCENGRQAAFGRDGKSMSSGAAAVPSADNLDGQPTKEPVSVPMFSCMGQRQLMLNSYAAVPLFSRGSFSLNVGLFARLSISYGVTPTATHVAAPLPPFFGFPFLTASDVLQFECIWRRMQWANIFNILCFSLPHARFPVCELVCLTPRTDWSLQADRALFSISGFWRAFVRDGLRRRDSLISSDSPAEQLSLPSDSDSVDGNVCMPEKITAKTSKGKKSSFSSSVQTTSRADAATSSTRSVSLWSSPSKPASASSLVVATEKGGTGGVKNAEDNDEQERRHAITAKGFVPVKKNAQIAGDISTDGRGSNVGKVCRDDDVDSSLLSVGRGSSTANAHMNYAEGEKYRWWRLEELRCGAGVAVKNDAVSGVNVYCGCSGHLGRALTFSTHVDALRRACCSITSSTASLDVAARLRINLITWHRTELDFGVGWRPFRNKSNITCKFSRSVGRTCLGVTIKDSLNAYSDWVYGKGKNNAGGETQLETHLDSKLLNSFSVAAADDEKNLSNTWFLSGVLYNLKFEGLRGLCRSLTSYLFFLPSIFFSPSSSSSAAPPAGDAMMCGPGIFRRMCTVARGGAEYTKVFLRQTPLDVTAGVASDRYRPGAFCFFLVVSST